MIRKAWDWVTWWIMITEYRLWSVRYHVARDRAQALSDRAELAWIHVEAVSEAAHEAFPDDRPRSPREEDRAIEAVRDAVVGQAAEVIKGIAPALLAVYGASIVSRMIMNLPDPDDRQDAIADEYAEGGLTL